MSTSLNTGAARERFGLVARAETAEVAAKDRMARQGSAAIALSLLYHPDHTASRNNFLPVVPLSPADRTGDIVDNHFPRLLYYSIEMKLE